MVIHRPAAHLPAPGRRALLRGIAAATGAALAPPLRAQSRSPIRLIVPFAPGGTADRIAREVAVHLGRHLDAPVDVQNIPADGGVVAMDEVSNAEPDGRTLGLANSTPIVVATLVKRQRSYDVFKDFTWVAIFGTYANGLVVRSREPLTLREWIDRAKAERKPLRYATIGEGSAGHLAGEFLRQTYGLELVHESIGSVLENYAKLDDGTYALVFDGVPSAIAQTSASPTRRIVAVTGERRYPQLTYATAFGELSTNASFVIWAGLVAPPGLPESERVPLFRAALATVNDPRFRARLVEMGIDPSQLVGKPALDFIEADFIRSAALLARLPPVTR